MKSELKNNMMTATICKICKDEKDLVPLSGEYLGLNFLDIIKNVTQSNMTTVDIGQSVVCNTCAGSLYLVHTKVLEYKRVFLPEQSKSVKKVQSASKNITSPKKKSNLKSVVDEVNEEKLTQAKQVNGDITSFLKPIVKTNVTAKTKKTLEPLLSTKKTTKENVTDVISRNEINCTSNIISCTDSEQDITEVKVSQPPAIIEAPTVNKPEPIRKRRNTVYSFDCEHCGFQSGLIRVFKNHLIEVHNVKTPRIFECKECNAKYVAKAGLDTHLKKCLKTNSEKDTTNNQDKAEEDSIKNNNPSSDSSVNTKTEVKSLEQNGLSESDDDKDSVNYESSPLSSTKLNQHKEITNGSTTKDQASKLNLTEDHKYDEDVTSMEFSIQVAKILPVVKKPVSLKDKPSMTKKNVSPLKKASSSKNKRSLSTNEDTPPSKKKRIEDNLKATKDISPLEDTSPMNDFVPTDVTSPKKKELSSPQRTSPLKKLSSHSKNEASKNDTEIFQFICSHCKKLIVGPKDYKRHLLVEHDDEDNHIFACEFCPKKYLAYRSLKLHLDKNHTTSSTTENSKQQNDPIIQGENIASVDDSFHSSNNFDNLSSKKGEHDSSTAITLQSGEELEKTIKVDEFRSPKKRKQKTKINESHSEKRECKKDIETPKKGVSNILADGSAKKKNLSVSFDIEDVNDSSLKDPEMQCPKCLKCFKSTKKLNRHISKAHSTVNGAITEQISKNDVFRCEHCSKAFSEKTFLLKHMKTKHEFE